MSEWYKHNHPGYSNCPRCVERIRELEAEVLLAHEQKQRIRELEAEIRRCYEMETIERERAEKAEARVAELEAMIHKSRPHRFLEGVCQDCGARERDAE